MSLRHTELAGSPKTIGECFGEQFRDGIRNLAESRTDHLVSFIQRYDPERNVSRRYLHRVVAETLEAHQLYDTAIWDEFDGIARAAGLSHEELLIANGLTDMRDYLLVDNKLMRQRCTAYMGECSAFLAPPMLTNGAPVVGQTWDMNNDAGEFIVVVHRKPDNGPETLGLTTVGCLSLIGMNSEGVSVGNTNLVPTDARPGVNYLFTITRALRCSSADEAADVIDATPRLSGHNYYTADATTVVNLETTGARSKRTDVTERIFVHTNHYLDADLKRLEFTEQNSEGSEFRYRQLSANVAEQPTPFTMEMGWEQLADNTREAGAICNEDADGTYAVFCTVATIVQSPAERTLWICAGGSRLGKREVFTF